MPHGGDLIADVLARHGATHMFTLCGGHISPLLTGAQARGLRVVDVRDEVNAVFAADAVARMTGTIGVAAVTAGPGVTNTITAVKNAQMAQSPLVIFGGATATLLKGRGSLLLGGQLGKAYFFSDQRGGFTTSSYYAKELPAWVQRWNGRRARLHWWHSRRSNSLPSAAKCLWYPRAMAHELH